MIKPEYWYDLAMLDNGRILGTKVPPFLRQTSSEKRAYTRYEGKHIVLYVKSAESAEVQRKMAYAWGAYLLAGTLVTMDFNKD